MTKKTAKKNKKSTSLGVDENSQISELENERLSLIREINNGNILPPDETEQKLESFDEAQIQAIDFAIDLYNKLEKGKRRKAWDKTLLVLVVVGFIASYILIILIGLNILTFANNSFAVPSVVAAGIIQTYGLARIAAEYFFSDDKNTPKK